MLESGTGGQNKRGDSRRAWGACFAESPAAEIERQVRDEERGAERERKDPGREDFFGSLGIAFFFLIIIMSWCLGFPAGGKSSRHAKLTAGDPRTQPGVVCERGFFPSLWLVVWSSCLSA